MYRIPKSNCKKLDKVKDKVTSVRPLLYKINKYFIRVPSMACTVTFIFIIGRVVISSSLFIL